MSTSSLLTKCAPLVRASRHRLPSPLPPPSAVHRLRLLKPLAPPPIAFTMKEISGAAPGRFQLSPSSVLKLQIGDITTWSVDGSSDAIVNAANERMLGGGGVDGAIHRAAGPELRAACYEVPEVSRGVRCPTGEARITPAFRLPVSRVIHTVGPIYGVNSQPEVFLRNAYRNSLRLAKENDIQYIAFPAISCGVYHYPYDEASKVAISAVKEFAEDFKEVHFVLFSDDIYQAWLASAREHSFLVGAFRSIFG